MQTDLLPHSTKMMNHHNNNNIPYNLLPPVPKAAPPPYKQQPPPGRIPEDFREAMIHVPMKPANTANLRLSGLTKTQNKSAGKSSVAKWKSSFQPLDEQTDSMDASDCRSERGNIYDPYDPLSSDSDQEMQQAQDHNQSPTDQDNTLGLQHLSQMTPSAGKWTSSTDDSDTCNFRSERWPLEVNVQNARQMQYDLVSEQEMVHNLNQFLPDQDHNLGHQRLSPSRGCKKKRRWGASYSESVSQPLERCDFSPETRPIETRGLSPAQTLPERHRAYGGQRTDGEERLIPEYSRESSFSPLEMTTPARLSPSRLQREYQHHLEYVERGLDQIIRSTEVPRNRSFNIIMTPISCDLCDVELSSGRDLEDHLESKSHWDTLEYIQQQNDYDDLIIAFLQEVMLYKSHQCSRAIEDSALQALQENDHMTKIEMFHCAACSVFVSTSASSVQAHITSQEHLTNTKEFQVQQRRSCLDKAQTMMKRLKPQFDHFLKGGRPFE